MSIVVDFSICPLGKKESVSAHVARAVKVISESGLPYQYGPMGTVIEGEWEEIAPLVSRCLQELEKDCNRIYFSLKGDLRKGKGGRIVTKVRRLEAKLKS